MAKTLGSYLGLSAYLKDCKDLGICPDYLHIERRMIELYEADKRNQNESAS